MSERVRSYRDLIVWQKSVALVTDVYATISRLPRVEELALSAQVRRAAVSIPANIAEGHGRPSTRDYLRFINIAAGSLRELETYLVIAHRLSYVQERQALTLLAQTDEIGRMLRALHRKLQQRNSLSLEGTGQRPPPPGS